MVCEGEQKILLTVGMRLLDVASIWLLRLHQRNQSFIRVKLAYNKDELCFEWMVHAMAHNCTQGRRGAYQS